MLCSEEAREIAGPKASRSLLLATVADGGTCVATSGKAPCVVAVLALP